MQSPPFPRYFVNPSSKYSPQHHVLNHPEPQCKNRGLNTLCYYRKTQRTLTKSASHPRTHTHKHKPTIILHHTTCHKNLRKWSMRHVYFNGKGIAIPLPAWRGLEGSWRLWLPDFKTIGTWWW
jgi:hypothetical protein